MASPPAAVTLSAAAPAGGNGKSVCRAARPRACAACSALHPATRATGAAFSLVCVAHVQSGFANCNAAAWFSQQQWSGRWPDFLQKPPRLVIANGSPNPVSGEKPIDFRDPNLIAGILLRRFGGYAVLDVPDFTAP